MGKIAKALQSLLPKERELIKNIILKIKTNSFSGLDLKKLKDCDNIFRVRRGKLRIIFRKLDNNEIYILAIERRSNNTYSDY